MVVCVCDADGHTSPKEEAFLAQVRQAWGMGVWWCLGTASGGSYTEFEQQAQVVADMPLQAAVPEASLPQDAAVPHPTAVDDLGSPNQQRRPGHVVARGDGQQNPQSIHHERCH